MTDKLVEQVRKDIVEILWDFRNKSEVHGSAFNWVDQFLDIKVGNHTTQELLEMELTPSLEFELNGMKHEFQDKLAELLNFASAMGDYGDPHGELAVIDPQTGKVLKREKDCG